ncbi:hypothetical protein VPNG_05276 [Cytospora leucostoma]|uniref:Uncharacterized protein n=1 Tax=Cytospora leucostoma TaxID=1230097 RepID=A0A423X7C7_9PEZI|nr:hypothetical protein VPNG_05276 [Cytospora leucostoma]
MLSKKTVLIMGCSDGGLGASIAKEFQARGYNVFATLRNLAKAGSLADVDGIEILELDVGSTESVRKVAHAVTRRTGRTLYALVNNAAHDYVLPLLDVDLEQAKETYDVNVWSIVATAQAFPPLLIKSKGTICNITSTAAFSSKIAATRISDVLCIELAPFGVKVITNVLGNVATPFFNNAPDLKLPEGSYYKIVEPVINTQQQGGYISGAEPVSKTAYDIVGDIIAGKSKNMSRGGKVGIVRFLTSWFPELLSNMWHADKGLKDLKELYH